MWRVSGDSGTLFRSSNQAPSIEKTTVAPRERPKSMMNQARGLPGPTYTPRKRPVPGNAHAQNAAPTSAGKFVNFVGLVRVPVDLIYILVLILVIFQ